MKRLLLRFMLVFLAVLTISYAAAPFDSSDGGHEKTERSRTRNLTSPKIQSLHTEGLARYIGVSNSYFKDKFGEPDEKIDSILLWGSLVFLLLFGVVRNLPHMEFLLPSYFRKDAPFTLRALLRR